jgi:hypothetical protein
MRRTKEKTRQFAVRHKRAFATALGLLALAGTLSITRAADCPPEPQQHLPQAPPPPLNIDKVKDVLLGYQAENYEATSPRFSLPRAPTSRGALAKSASPRSFSISMKRRCRTGRISRPTISASSRMAPAIGCQAARAASRHGYSKAWRRRSCRRSIFSMRQKPKAWRSFSSPAAATGSDRRRCGISTVPATKAGPSSSPAPTMTHIPRSKPTRPRNVASSRRQVTRSSRPSATSRATSTAVSLNASSKCQILFTSFGEERSEDSGHAAIPPRRRQAAIACAESRDSPRDRRT